MGREEKRELNSGGRGERRERRTEKRKPQRRQGRQENLNGRKRAIDYSTYRVEVVSGTADESGGELVTSFEIIVLFFSRFLL